MLHAKMNKVKKYMCKYCGNKFSAGYVLENHIKTAIYCLKIRGITKKKKYKCGYCFQKYLTNQSLVNHVAKCKKKKSKILDGKIICLKNENKGFVDENCHLRNENDQLLNENKKLKNKNNKLNTNNSKYKQKNKDLKKQIIELQKKLAKKEGEVDGIIKAPVRNVTNKNINTTTTYVNPKLMNIKVDNIKPLTIERLKKQIANGEFTDKHFEKGVDGIVEFLVPIMTLKRDDGTVERNYVCTDVSRNKFYRLEEGKIWKSDSGGLFIGEAIQGLGPSVNDSYRRLVNKKHSTDNDYMKNVYKEKINKLMPIFRASVGNFNDEFMEVLAKTKNKVKHHIAV